MDCRTGDIYRFANPEGLVAAQKLAGRMLAPLTEEQADTMEQMPLPKRKNWMRNQPCPCKSGHKFKRCCWSKYA